MKKTSLIGGFKSPILTFPYMMKKVIWGLIQQELSSEYS